MEIDCEGTGDEQAVSQEEISTKMQKYRAVIILSTVGLI